MAVMMTEAKLRQCMQELAPRMIALAAGICRDRHQAEEIVQEAFIRLWRKPPEHGDVVIKSWLRKVVTNLSINALQRTKRPGALPEFSDDRSMLSRDRAEGSADSREQVDSIRRAMDRLDDEKRAILMLRAHEELSYEEIAEHLGVPVGTVMSRLNRARTALIEEMKKDSSVTDDQPEVFQFRQYKQG
ncbi:MAG TPA: RNA polymerase sigma factor [Phycisphaerales bacterium]|nr:RNA polymerase sigma factor [Phycisphaerales bacterium]